jgi:phage replication-related protein YjqB (UPF0714/DUF867 family)
MERYESYHRLKMRERQGEDYRIRLRLGKSDIAIVAPHGGGIEPGTSEIAEAVAGDHHTFYAFEGLKERGNDRLHITSVRFDEPVGMRIAKSAGTVLSIHGCREREQVIYLGGKESFLRDLVEAVLSAANFSIRMAERLPGLNPRNICNLGRSNKGLQLELSFGLRRAMFRDFQERTEPTPHFTAFVSSLRNALSAFCMKASRRSHVL